MIGRRKETDKRETVAQRHKQKQKSNKYSFLIKSITPSHQYNRFGMFTEKKKSKFGPSSFGARDFLPINTFPERHFSGASPFKVLIVERKSQVLNPEPLGLRVVNC